MKPRVNELARYIESTMTCTGHVRRVIRVDTDPMTGQTVPVYEDVYAGPCLVYAHSNEAQVVNIAGTQPTLSRYAVTLPAGAPIQIGDVFTATNSPLAPELEGVLLRITDTPLNAWQAALACTAERLH